MNYTAQKGFFDISVQPKTLDSRTFKKLQEAQMQLSYMAQRAEYYKQYHPQQWQKGKEMSGELQQIIFKHWSHEELFGLPRKHQIEMSFLELDLTPCIVPTHKIKGV